MNCVLKMLFMILYLILSTALVSSFGYDNDRRLPIKMSVVGLHDRLKDSNVLRQASTFVNISVPWNAPSLIWKIAIRAHALALPLLHAFDKCYPKNNNNNLFVLWWKAISGNRWFTPTYDNGIAYDLLPSWTRCIVSFPFSFLYPLLHHQNVAIRTLYLDKILQDEIRYYAENTNQYTGVDVVILGGGFDTRSLRFGRKDINVSWYEIDLPSVITQKKLLLGERYLKRRPDAYIPQLHSADLNDMFQVKSVLDTILTTSNHGLTTKRRPVIFLIEAVLIYLNQSIINTLFDTLLEATSSSLSSSNIAHHFKSTQHEKCDNITPVSICFADTIPIEEKDENCNFSATELIYDNIYLLNHNANTYFKNRKVPMKLISWLLKPGRAKHMGVARTSF